VGWFKKSPPPEVHTLVHKGKVREIKLSSLSYEELLVVAEAMIYDWETLNSLHNERATQEGWCPTYEGNQNEYNTRFKVLQLKPRAKNRNSGWHGDEYALTGRSYYADSNIRRSRKTTL